MIPVTLVTGFLGAGKTSLVANLLDSTPERPIAVLVNELARTSVDSALLHGGEHLSVDEHPLIRSVSGGRAGAGKLEAVRAELTRILDTAASGTRPEAVVVETSGSSPVAAIVRLIAQDPALAAALTVDTVITLVDTANLAVHWKDPQLRSLLRDQIASADLIVLNKTDRAGFWTRRSALRLAKRLNPAAEIASAEHARLPVEETIATGRRDRIAPAGFRLAGQRHGARLRH